MIARVFIIIAVALVTQFAVGSATNIEETIRNGIATRDALNNLSTNDIPEKWRTRVEDQSTETHVKKVFLRGNERMLEVTWNTNWSGSMSNIFAATVYDKAKKIGTVFGFSDGTVSVMQPRKTRNDYDMTTLI